MQSHGVYTHEDWTLHDEDNTWINLVETKTLRRTLMKKTLAWMLTVVDDPDVDIEAKMMRHID